MSEDLDYVVFADASHGWILTANGRVLRTLDGGRSWKVVYTPGGDNEEVAGLAVLNAARVWASGSRDQGGSNYGESLMSLDGGRTWKQHLATNLCTTVSRTVARSSPRS